jgi:hypothetical protein
MQRVAIIGFGMLGMVASYFLDSKLFEIHIFDLEFDPNSATFFPEPEGPKTLKHLNSAPMGSPGNAIFWGGAITNSFMQEDKWSRSFLRNMPIYVQKLSQIGFPDTHFQEITKDLSTLSINYADTTLFMNSIKRNMESQTNIFRHNRLVSKIEVAHGKTNLESVSPSEPTLKMNFDFVLVCAGPIQSFNLLNESALLPKLQSIKYFDHPTYTLGSIKTCKPKLINSHLRNSGILYGNRASAIIYFSDTNTLFTIRLRPLLQNDLSEITYDSFSQILRSLLIGFSSRFGFYFVDRFSVKVSVDFLDPKLTAFLDRNGKIEQFKQDNRSAKLEDKSLTDIEKAIERVVGECQFEWEHPSNFQESAAAHYSGFLASHNSEFRDKIIDGNRLKDFPSIFVPGSVSFPSAVVGHPTYVAILNTIHSVEKLNSL